VDQYSQRAPTQTQKILPFRALDFRGPFSTHMYETSNGRMNVNLENMEGKVRGLF